MARKVATIAPTGQPLWSRDRQVGDYGGHLAKEASATEGETPYAWHHYREMQSMRGSAFTTKTNTLVDCENLAIARMQSAFASRLPEKIRANSTPGRSDEKLDYWVKVLAIPVRAGDRRWHIRELCAIHYRAARGPTLTVVMEALAELLPDVFVTIHTSVGTNLATPPDQTFWPLVNPGPAAYDLGGGAWLADRAYINIEVQQPAGMLIADFLQLMDVQMFTLLDRMLPAWVGWTWTVGSDGFFLDISPLDLTGLTPT